jgi:hypothetical protein
MKRYIKGFREFILESQTQTQQTDAVSEVNLEGLVDDMQKAGFVSVKNDKMLFGNPAFHGKISAVKTELAQQTSQGAIGDIYMPFVSVQKDKNKYELVYPGQGSELHIPDIALISFSYGTHTNLLQAVRTFINSTSIGNIGIKFEGVGKYKNIGFQLKINGSKCDCAHGTAMEAILAYCVQQIQKTAVNKKS